MTTKRNNYYFIIILLSVIMIAGCGNDCPTKDIADNLLWNCIYHKQDSIRIHGSEGVCGDYYDKFTKIANQIFYLRIIKIRSSTITNKYKQKFNSEDYCVIEYDVVLDIKNEGKEEDRNAIFRIACIKRGNEWRALLLNGQPKPGNEKLKIF